MMTGKFSAVLACLFLLSACSGMAGKLDKQIDAAGAQVSSLVKETGRTAPGVVVGPAPSVTHESGIWLGKDIVKLGPPALPKVFYQEATFDKSVGSLAELAERLSLRSALPVKISPDALAIADAMRGAEGGAPLALPGPPGLARPALAASAARVPAPVRIYYAHGNFKGLLDSAAARFGVSWKYADGAIKFYHTDSRTFQISTLPGDSSFSATVASGATSTAGASGGGGGGGGGGGAPGGAGGAGGGGANGVSSNNSQNTAVASRLSVYSSIETAVKAMLSPYGKVVSSPATGSITVVDIPDSLARVGAYIENENKTMSRQVMINVTVLSVSLSDAEDYGINWNLVYNSLRQQYGITSALPVSLEDNRFFAGIVGNSKFAGSTAIMNALSKQGKVRRQTTASVITLNNQVVPLQVAKQTAYLQSSQTTTVPLVGTTTSLSPGSITTGFNMSILPHVLTNGTVLLQFSTDISALRQMREVQSGTSKIESPEVDTRNFLQRVALKSNETLIISGFEQTDDNLDRQGVGDARNAALGGGVKTGSDKESIVILITPSIVGS